MRNPFKRRERSAISPPEPNMKVCPFCSREQFKPRIIEVSGWQVHQCHWCLATGPYGMFGQPIPNGKNEPITAWNIRR